MTSDEPILEISTVRDEAVRAIEVPARRLLGKLFGQHMVGWVAPKCHLPGQRICAVWPRTVNGRTSLVHVHAGMEIREVDGRPTDATGLWPGWDEIAATIRKLEPAVHEAEIAEQLVFRFAKSANSRRRAS